MLCESIVLIWICNIDVDVKIEACGVCGSDVHTISGGWGDQKFPLCVGHGS